MDALPEVNLGPDQLALAFVKACPIAAAVLALLYGVWKFLLPAVQQFLETRARINEAQFHREEAARKSRDEAWQASLREIGQRHQNATEVAVSGFRDALDRSDRVLDRFADVTTGLARDMGAVKTDVAVLRTDIHAVVQRLGEPSGTFSRVQAASEEECTAAERGADRAAERSADRTTADRMPSLKTKAR